ncbi:MULTISPECIES: DUF5997 family protein [unclassified Rhodococcus (in: high G+C Gram-positive bacteria)]|uniref:DUF5997 family protein n=1 Tax=unclassified Rhodococcus (in: high G+C Gram-positive bacteria) TaxID=192944 RepID=UPI0007BB8940|nr:hypothetical protein A2J02_06325 [Rhodococcus sp. EPR-147]KZF05642.1 hypothetical protein A2J04_25040 [Rhodococcus sp. EPR-279]
MSPENKQQTMKPLTAANKLGIYLPAAPEEFQNSMVSRSELDALRSDPPQWLTDLQTNGPFPRDVIAKKLGVSIAGLARGGVTEALTNEAIEELVASPPQWLVRERRTQIQVRKDAERIKEKQEARRTSGNRPTKLRNL